MPASSKDFLDIQATIRVWIHSETRAWHDKNIQLSSLIFSANKLVDIQLVVCSVSLTIFTSSSLNNDLKIK